MCNNLRSWVLICWTLFSCSLLTHSLLNTLWLVVIDVWHFVTLQLYEFFCCSHGKCLVACSVYFQGMFLPRDAMQARCMLIVTLTLSHLWTLSIRPHLHVSLESCLPPDSHIILIFLTPNIVAKFGNGHHQQGC